MVSLLYPEAFKLLILSAQETVKLTIFITIPNSYSNVSQLSFAQSAC
jgi:hypothetical protein